MELPTIKTEVIFNEKRGIKFVLLGYRPLTREEAIASVRAVVAQMKGKLKPRTTYTITTLYGANE